VTDPTTPLRIHADRGAGTLEIGWADGHETRYGSTALRWLCPCAFCRGEAGLPGWLDSRPTLTPDQTRIVDVQLVGQYAIAPTWGDGHHTGYYTFALLRDRCPCDECTARRVREAGPASTGQAHAAHANGQGRTVSDHDREHDHHDHGKDPADTVSAISKESRP
jgi:DUF971 family protein